MGKWLNADKLYIKTGVDEATNSIAGEYSNLGATREVEFKLDLTTLTSSDAILDDNVMIPKGAFIEEVVVIATEAATGSSSTLTLGLYKTDRSAVVDADAFVNAAALTTIDAAGETTVYRIGTSGVGSSVGTAIAENGLLSGKYGTSAFTDGTIRVRVRYSF